jgi:hypothetical protein
MTQRSLALLIAVAAAGSTLAAPALAHDYRPYGQDCTNRIHHSGTTGALLGGLAGAVIGSNLAAHHGGRSGGALIGAAAGAAVGSNVARSSTKQACRGDDYGYYDRGYDGRAYDGRAYDGYPAGYYAPPAYSYGYVQPAPAYYGGYSGYGEGDEHHDRGRHRGWEKHGHHDHDDDDD